MKAILSNILGAPVADAEEESFLLFAQPIPSRSLGFIDPKAPSLTITIDNTDLQIAQSPSLLTSNLPGGTTGAVLWSITPLLASWLVHPRNPLFAALVTSTSTVLELGAGISGLLALTLGARVGRYVATDQAYALRLLRANVVANVSANRVDGRGKGRGKGKPRSKGAKGSGKGKGGSSSSKGGNGKGAEKDEEDEEEGETGNVHIVPLDWETTDVGSLVHGVLGLQTGVDVVVACDCVYNDALVEPFVRACVEVCRCRDARQDAHEDMQNEEEEEEQKQTVCIVAQQLRSAEVFEAWLGRFMRDFEVWRVQDDWGGVEGWGLGEGSGFVVHVGVLRG
ncbi:hypothetical protein EJ05DRAFT_534547 [Pseudovirgaria hyperparasitica]|uniref:Uncharacterized protein n=1 Tax=Pseudovirgaria hyperparasitica TaxID=470096 RepID=A0A6A6WLV7_9PEZI|nr:uncharacterized protein EJ05DRAFT_534547 [Pseudovirgaria hyperparasitica]KAF2763142.1 hypothetical protein EJ05DRAFT_534547 [Pseudovirgaria hyperparasitica]